MASIKIKPIQNGTVIDHLPSQLVFKIADILDLCQSQHTVIVARNLFSQKMGRKGMIKIEGTFLSKKELDKISLLAQMASVNIIKDGKRIDKFKLSIPETINNLATCSNVNCVSNVDKECLDSKLLLETGADGKKFYRCFYCEKLVEIAEIKIK